MRSVYANRTHDLGPTGEIFVIRKITETAVRTIRCPADKREIFVRDTELRGFGLRVSRNVTSFIYEARRNGHPQRQTIGQWPAWSADEARERAADLSAAAAKSRASPADSAICGGAKSATTSTPCRRQWSATAAGMPNGTYYLPWEASD